MSLTRGILAVLLLGCAVSCGDDNGEADPAAQPTPSPAVCGDGRRDTGELCEPLEFCRGGCNPTTGLCVDIGCNDDCTCPAPRCGDAVLDFDEDCDPPGGPPFGGCDLPDLSGTQFALFGCTADCLCDSDCGDGFRAPHEDCEDGNLIDGDGCSSACAIESGGR